MTENLQETTKKIKQRLRLAMNGIVSAHQRQNGLNYKINFGVEIPRLKEIAKEYPQERKLALELWNSSVRECKLLAIFLLPTENYSEVAETWISETTNCEIADHLSLNILCNIPHALARAIEWTGKTDGFYEYCGYLTITHCLRKGCVPPPEQEKIIYKNIAALFEREENTITHQRACSLLCSMLGNDSTKAMHALQQFPADCAAAIYIKEYII